MSTILFQGDSVTDCGRARDVAQPNVGLGSGYALLAAAQLLANSPENDWKVFNRGVSGNRVVDLYARWKIDALNLNPDLISILIGVNDTWHEFANRNGVEIDRYETIYRMLLEWTRRELPACRLLLISPFAFQSDCFSSEGCEDVLIRAAIVKKLAAEFGTMFLDGQAVFNHALKQAPPLYWLGDGVHPTCAGHQLLASAWLDVVKKG